MEGVSDAFIGRVKSGVRNIDQRIFRRPQLFDGPRIDDGGGRPVIQQAQGKPIGSTGKTTAVP